MIDTHTHLYLTESFPDGGKEATERAIAAGVDRLILPNIDLESVEPLLKLHALFPSNTFIAAGVHPTEVDDRWNRNLKEIFRLFEEIPLVGIGEIGLDLHWDKRHIVAQMDAFGTQLDMAYETGLPAIIHSRDAYEETVEVLKLMGRRLPKLVFHSFTYTPKEAEGFLCIAEHANFGFNGVITFKNAREVRDSAHFVGIERIVAETDSPYLAPVPHRGEQNESSYLPYIVKAIAGATGVEPSEAEKIITVTSERLFALPSPETSSN